MYNCLLIFHKKQVISNQINENRKNTKGLFQIINILTGNKDENQATRQTAEELVEDIPTFFLEKNQQNTRTIQNSTSI